MKKIAIFLSLLIVITCSLVATPKANAADYLQWYFYSNNSTKIVWQVAFRYFYKYKTPYQGTGSTWKYLVNRPSALCTSGGNLCQASDFVGSSIYSFPLSGGTNYAIQWGTACLDPYVNTNPPTTYYSGSDRFFNVGHVNITAPMGDPSKQGGISNSVMTEALREYVAAGGGTLYWNGWTSVSNCPVVRTPAPPANLQDPTFCQGTASGVTFQWNPVPYDSSYDLEWKYSGSAYSWPSSPQVTGIGTSTHSDGQIWYRSPQSTTCNSPSSCSGDFSYGRTYDWRVRAHTVTGVGGPTGWAYGTFTANNCAAPVNHTISGTVFLDDGSGGGIANDGIRNGTEPVFTGGASLRLNTGATTSSNASGAYSFSQPNGTYSVSASATGYSVTSTNPRSVTLNGADVGGINFGLRPNVVAPSWYQSVGGDVRIDNGISVAIPTGQYFSAKQTTPIIDGGVIFTSAPSASFGGGSPNENNWLAKNSSFSPLPPGIKTSYAFIDASSTKLGVAPISISTFPSSLPTGNYLYKTTGNLTMTGANFTFPANGTYVILVNGNLNINQNLIVPTTSTAVFIVKGNIIVGAGVNNLQGIYSSDQQFKFDSLGPGLDSQLIVQGSIIGNANLQTTTPFVNLRDLGTTNSTTPSVKVVFRPDFVLHLPDLIKKPTYSVSEIAPIGGN